MALAKLLPEFHPRPWGRRSLAPLYTIPANTAQPIGEAWLSSVSCRVLCPGRSPSEGTLGELWAQMTAAERGSELAGLERFPLLLKFIFTADKLSVQVHPDNAYAQLHQNEPWGKTEMWYVVAAEAEAWVRVGLRPGITRAELQRIFGKPELEDALHHIPVQAGDAIFVPAGTVHAIGPGLCLCEIQQYSDVTYRIYDYDRPGLDGRKRALHTEQALAVARLETPEAGRVAPMRLALPNCEAERFVSGPYFVVERYRSESACELTIDPRRFSLLVFYSGKGRVSTGLNGLDYTAGDALLVSADSVRIAIEPTLPTEFLRASALGVQGQNPTG